MTTRNTALEQWAFWTLAGSLAAVQLTLAVAETLFGISALLWLVLAIRDRRRPDVPAFFMPLLALAAWTLVSTALSPDPVVEPSARTSSCCSI